MKILKVVAISLLLAGCGFHNPSSGFNLYQNFKDDARLSIGSLKSDDRDMFIKAINNWNTHIGKNYFKIDEKNPEVYVSFGNNDIVNGVIYNGRVVFRPFYKKTVLEISDTLNYEDQLKTIYHELGHIIGLKHNRDIKSIMYINSDSETFEPSQKDITDAKNILEMR